MITDEIYALGYAIPEYNISDKYDCWRFRDEHFKTPKGIDRVYKKEWPEGICGALIEDVRKMAIK